MLASSDRILADEGYRKAFMLKKNLNDLFDMMDRLDNGEVSHHLLDGIRKIRNEFALTKNQAEILRKQHRKG